MTRFILPLAFCLLLAGLVLAQQKPVPAPDSVHSISLPSIPVALSAGEGRTQVTRYCNICHSTDYIPMQPGFSEQKWAAIVHKMIKVYGAPVPEKAAAQIAAYLGAHYGPGR